MFCRECGNNMADNAVFCSNCGAKTGNNSHNTPRYQNIPNRDIYANYKPVRKKRSKGLIAVVTITVIAAAFIYLLFRNGEKIIDTVNNASGIVEINGSTIILPDNESVEKAQLNIKAVKSNNINNKEVEFQSDTYVMDGYLGALQGKVRIEIPISDDHFESIIKDSSDLGDRLFMVYTEDTPTDNGDFVETFIDTNIDLDKRIVWAELDFDGSNTEPSQLKASLLKNLFMACNVYAENENTTALGRGQITFKYKKYWFVWKRLVADSGNFEILFKPGSTIGTSDQLFYEYIVEKLLGYLEESKTMIEGLGFSFEGAKKPVVVHIEAMPSGSGSFNGSRLFSTFDHIKINRSHFMVDNDRLPDAGNQRYTELKAVAGHELLHVAQELYNPQWDFVKHTGVFSHPFIWLDEATAKWFEAKAVKNPSYLPERSLECMEFIHKPLYFTQKREHGYGAMFFIKYLENSLGSSAFVYETYLHAKANAGLSATSDAITAEALGSIMKRYGTSLEEEWIKFVSTYMMNSASIIRGLSTSNIKDNRVSLHARDAGEKDISMEFKSALSGRPVYKGALNGSTKAKKSPVIDISFNLSNLSADYLKIDLGNTHKLFNTPGKIAVNVTGSQNCGVLVYDDRGQPLAGSPWSFISSSKDQRFKGSQELTISSFGAGNIDEVILIPFNFDTSSVKSTSEIKIQITYIPGKLPEDPEPSPSPSEPEKSTPDDAVNDSTAQPISGQFSCIGVGYVEQNTFGWNIEFKESSYYGGIFKFESNGKFSFGFTANGKVYSTHYGTYSVAETGLYKNININDRGQKLEKKKRRITTYNLNYINDDQGRDLNNSDSVFSTVTMIDEKYIYTSYGFNAYIKD